MKISELRVYVDELPKKDLLDIIVELYKTGPHNRNIIENRINLEDEESKLQKYKAIIKNEFFLDGEVGQLRYSVMRKAINNFKKIAKNPENIVDLMLVYVETGVAFTNTFGDIDDTFYTKIENMFADSLKYIFEHGLEKNFKQRCFQIKLESENIGWGFSDNMEHFYYEYYVNVED